MKVTSIYDQGVGNINEDRLLITENLRGVFDGATSLDKYIDTEGHTSGFLAAEIARTVFEKNDKPLVQLALESNETIHSEMKRCWVDISNPDNLWRTTAAVVRIKENVLERLRVADSLILVIKNDNSFQLLGKYVNQDIEVVRLWKEYADKKEDNIRDKVMRKVMEMRRRWNIDYGVLDWEIAVKDFIQQGQESLDDVKYILIFTDGLFIDTENPDDETDWNLFIALYLEWWLEHIMKYVRESELSDPKCRKYPRFKQHDDIAAIALTL